MKRVLSGILALTMVLSLAACGGETASSAPAERESAASAAPVTASEAPEPAVEPEASAESVQEPAAETYAPTAEELAARAEIEEALNLQNMADQNWSYDETADAWVMGIVVDVVNPELPDQQGVSVCVPGAYVLGIDTDGDGEADATEGSEVSGALVIDHAGAVTSTHGQTYTADTAPVIFTTGAMGYSSSNNSLASTTYAAEGYIAMSCGNRGKQDAVTDEDGNVLYYTGDAPSCLCDQKAAVRFVKYNMLLGNLPGSVDHFVTTGGSGGAAHASMYAATSNHPDFYDYQIESGAVGVYQNGDGSYSTTVTVDGSAVTISDGVWGTVAYSAITPLAQADMAQAFEYYMDPTYEFSTPFQAQLAEYLAKEYMDYVNGQNFSVEEARVGFDLDGDGSLNSTVPLTIEYDPETHPETNGYYGSYLDLYLCEFTANLQSYLDNLDYADGWTWFDENGTALSDDDVANMTHEDRVEAFLNGRYAKANVQMGPPDGGGMMGPPPDAAGGDTAGEMFGGDIRGGGPGAGATSASGNPIDSANYGTFEEMAEAYKTDVESVLAGDRFGKNQVELYNPMNYIGAEGTEDPTFTRIVMGAVEGDIAMMCSLNMELQWLSAGTDAVIEWQWDGGHVPSEVLGDSLGLYVDEMYGKHAGGVEVTKPQAAPQTTNGSESEPTGNDLSGWVQLENGTASFTLADVMAYRNTGASKAVPGFDVMDYGQEDWVFGNSEQDARHWNAILNEIFQNPDYAEVLSPLFNQNAD